MKIRVTCPRCSSVGLNGKQYSINYQDEGRYIIPCEEGHRDVIVLRQQKFEVLFDIGANAILDEYFREAVSSFTSSMERVFEFFLKAVFFEKAMHDEMSALWKQISSQSERQLGGFVSIYTLTIGVPPKLLSNKEIQFRNDVVHKGEIPTRDEAVAYGQSVLNVVRPVIEMVRTKFPNGLLQTIIQHDKACRKAEDRNDLIAGFNANTILNLSVTGKEWHERTLEQALRDLVQIRRI